MTKSKRFLKTTATFSWHPPPLPPPLNLEDLFGGPDGKIPPVFGALVGMIYLSDFSSRALFDATLFFLDKWDG